MFGEELLNLVGIRKLTRLAWTGQLHEFLESNKFRGETLLAKAGGWLAQAHALNGTQAYEVHKVWVYFAELFGMELAGTIEERPGIPPGPQHTRQVTTRIKAESIPLILIDNYYNPALPNNIARETGARVVILPNQVEGEPGIDTYFELIDHLISRITEGLEPSN